MKKVIVAVLIIALLGIGVFMFTKNNSNAPKSTSTDQSSKSTSQIIEEDTVSVEIRDFVFSPSAITIKKGTTVTWTNNDSTSHNAVSEQTDGPDGPLLSQGQTYSFTFNTIGTFDYFCEPHPQMTGTVTVVD